MNLQSVIPRPGPAILVLLHACAIATGAVAQDQLRTWGVREAVDTEAFHVPVQRVSVAANRLLNIVVTADGRLLAFGENYDDIALPPPAPSGLTYTNVTASGVPIGVLSNGQLVQWTNFAIGSSPPTGPPSLPPGMTWVDVASTPYRSFALRSDGAILSWGITGLGLEMIPALAAGLFYESITTGGAFAVARVSDGTLRVWGVNVGGVLTVLPLPAGVVYMDVRAGFGHVVAWRSDGQVLAWGDNYYGQCNVPALPAGMQYVDIAAGGEHSLALRSDGQWLAWGRNDYGQCNVPAVPTGTFARVFGGLLHTVAQRADGYIESWGLYETVPALAAGDSYRELDALFSVALVVQSDGTVTTPMGSQSPPAPILPAGVHYVACSAGVNFCLGLGSDGQVRAWGDNLWGQLLVPPLPPGVVYTDVDAGNQVAVALRSDGRAAAWGHNGFNQTQIPVLPPGQSYVDAAAGPHNILLLRSDGNLVMSGTASQITGLPPAPVGLRYTGVACGQSIAAALLSDGSIVSWPGSGNTSVPTLPAGVSYVEVECANSYAVARRSDGVVVTWGSPSYASDVPDPGPGRTYLRVAANTESSAGLIGSASRYQRVAGGCGGSLPASRLVPRDTPQIGRTMPVLLTNLPASAALMVIGWSHLRGGVPLAPLGMPGCSAYVSLDAAALVSGSGGQATIELAVPYSMSLKGVRFFNQALVFDPAAGNPFGAVLSEAMAATVGG